MLSLLLCLCLFGLIVYKLFLHHIIFKKNINIISYLFLYLKLSIVTEDIYIHPYQLFSTVDSSQIISIVPAKKDAIEVLMPIKNRWYMIGTALEVSSGDLDGIKYSNIPVDEKLATMMST